MKILKKLQEPSFWLYVVGYAQILDIVSYISLHAQAVGVFPTSVYNILQSKTKELQSLSNVWQWKEKIICEKSMGSPLVLVNELKAGHFQPLISNITRNKAAAAMNARRNWRMEADYIPVTAEEVQTGDIPVNIPDET